MSPAPPDSLDDPTIRFSAIERQVEIENASLLAKIPKQRRQFLAPYILSDRLNPAQKSILTSDAANTSWHLNDVLAEADRMIEFQEAFRQQEPRVPEAESQEPERTRFRAELLASTKEGADRVTGPKGGFESQVPEMGRAATQGASEATALSQTAPADAGSYLSQIARTEDTPSPAVTTSASAEAPRQPVISAAEMPKAELEEQANLTLSGFKRLLKIELGARTQPPREHETSQEFSNPLSITGTKQTGYRESEPLGYIFKTKISPKAEGSFLGEHSIPGELAPSILRALRPTERGRRLDFPREFDPEAFAQALQAKTFERPQPKFAPEIRSFLHGELQVPTQLISSVRLAHLVEGRVVELSEDWQPQNPRDLFEKVFGQPLPVKVIETLAKKGEFGQSHEIRVSAEHVTIGALDNGQIGLELLMLAPTRGGREREFAMLGAGLMGNTRLATLLAQGITVY